MYYWNDSAYIRKESDKLVLKGLKSRVIIKLSDLSPTFAKQLIKQDRIDDATLEARERRFLKRLNELGFFQTENYELESSHSRTIRFLSYFSTSPLALFKQINSAHLVIVGMGGIGQVVTEHLVAAGVRSFTLIDGDRVERSNVNRQFLVDPKETGKAKVDAIAAALTIRYPDLSLTPVDSYIRSIEDLKKYITEKTSMIVCAADCGMGVNPKSIIVETCIERSIPCAFAAVGVTDGEIGPIIEDRGAMEAYLSFLRQSEKAIIRASVPKGSICFTNTLVGTALAMEIYRYLCVGSSPLCQHTCLCSFMSCNKLVYRKIGSEG